MKFSSVIHALLAMAVVLGLQSTGLAQNVPQACVSALQGRIAWDYAGNTAWVSTNLDRLCRGGAGDQPAQCFQRVMHGGVDFGGGTRWEWANAINLCQGTRNAAVTVGCFQGLLQGGRPWAEAISTCGAARGRGFPNGVRQGVPMLPPGVQPGVPVMPPGVNPGVMVPAAPPVILPTDPLQECRSALEGRVAWDYSGSTTWAPQNVERLCRGGVRDQPARCFQRVMHGGVNFGGGARWEWTNAIELCHGSHDAAATVTCFESQLRVNRPWRQAISNCSH